MPGRKRLQVHLSTAIVLMFVAGGLLALNMRQQKVPFVTFSQQMIDEINDFDKRAFASITSKTSRLDVVWDERHRVTSMGWPCRAIFINDFAYTVGERPDWSVAELTHNIRYVDLAIDLAFAGSILLLAWWTSETIIRRRTNRGN